MIALFFMYQQFGGGATSYTAHLYESLKRSGHAPVIYRVRARGEEKPRPFAKYEGVTYRNVSPAEALAIAKDNPSLLTAPCHSKYTLFYPNIIGDLMKAGMRVVIHDPNEFKVYDHLSDRSKIDRPICIRPTMQKFFSDAVFIPHPYVREYGSNPAGKRKYLAVSVARVSFVKRTDIICAANSKLQLEDRVVLRGAENRLYTRHRLGVECPDWKKYTEDGATGFPMTWGASARECKKGKFAVDMTYFPDDGGGSQYSFMEAWDAGTVNIINTDWLRYPGEMVVNVDNSDNINCMAVSDAKELANLLKIGHGLDVDKIVAAGERQLNEVHAPAVVAAQYLKELER